MGHWSFVKRLRRQRSPLRNGGPADEIQLLSVKWLSLHEMILPVHMASAILRGVGEETVSNTISRRVAIASKSQQSTYGCSTRLKMNRGVGVVTLPIWMSTNSQ